MKLWRKSKPILHMKAWKKVFLRRSIKRKEMRTSSANWIWANWSKTLAEARMTARDAVNENKQTFLLRKNENKHPQNLMLMAICWMTFRTIIWRGLIIDQSDKGEQMSFSWTTMRVTKVKRESSISRRKRCLRRIVGTLLTRMTGKHWQSTPEHTLSRARTIHRDGERISSTVSPFISSVSTWERSQPLKMLSASTTMTHSSSTTWAWHTSKLVIIKLHPSTSKSALQWTTCTHSRTTT